MGHAIYRGTEHPELVGESALVRPAERPGHVLAQFDRHLFGADGRAWHLGWHVLPTRDMPLAIRIAV